MFGVGGVSALVFVAIAIVGTYLIVAKFGPTLNAYDTGKLGPEQAQAVGAQALLCAVVCPALIAYAVGQLWYSIYTFRRYCMAKCKKCGNIFTLELGDAKNVTTKNYTERTTDTRETTVGHLYGGGQKIGDVKGTTTVEHSRDVEETTYEYTAVCKCCGTSRPYTEKKNKLGKWR